MEFIASEKRYDTMQYRKCGESGLKLPAISLGLWHNFGDNDDFETMCKMCFTAFDHGITHFDLANNYGPKAGSAEIHFGKILHQHLMPYLLLLNPNFSRSDIRNFFKFSPSRKL